MKMNKDEVKKCVKTSLYGGATAVSLASSIKGLTDKNSSKTDKVLSIGTAAISAYFGYKTTKSAMDLGKTFKTKKITANTTVVELDQNKSDK